MTDSSAKYPIGFPNLLFEKSPIPYISIDEQGNILDVNDKWLSLLGYKSKEKVLGFSFTDHLSGSAATIFEENFSVLRKEYWVEISNLSLQHKNGNEILLNVNGQAQLDSNGDFISAHFFLHSPVDPECTTKALQESEQRYRRLSDATFESIFISEKGICMEQNSTAEMMFGYTMKEAVGKPGTDWIIPEDRNTVIDNILSNYEKPYEVTALRKDGSTFPCEIQGRTIQNGDRTVRVTALRDITERKQAESRLRDSEQRHRSIFNNSPVGLVRYDRYGHIADCNEKFISQMGSSKGKLIGFNLIKDSTPEISAVLQKAINGEVADYEGYYTSVTGGKKAYFRAIFNPIDPENIPTGVIAVTEDISERKEVEIKLAESEKKFRLLAENAQDIIYRFSIPEKKFIYISPATMELTGYTPDDFYENPQFFFGIAHPDWTEYINRQWLNMANGRQASMIEYQIIHKSGAIRWMQQSNLVLLDENGTPATAEGIVRDVTELKNTLEKLEKAKEKAEAASQVKSAFLANMSHEIRTPLNGILGMLQLMKDNDPPSRHRGFINTAMQASKRLNNLLSDILDLARVEAGKLIIQENIFNPTEILQQTYDIFNSSLRQSEIEFNMDMASDLPSKVSGDSLRLQQILYNIVGNALKFTSKGNVTLKVESLPASTDRTTLLFTVSDTGKGIPDDMLDDIFKSFTQLSRGYTREHQGVGLGLSICKQLVQLMNGTISVESVEGVGTTFYISLPFKVIPHTPASKSDQKSENPKLPLDGYKVLVVEDEKINRLYTKRFLEQEGCEVETVDNGQKAMDLMTYEDFDLVVMDVQMPVMNGLETTKAIRRGETGAHNKRIPIVAVTAYAMPEDKEIFFKAGMNDCLSKPVEKDKLHTVIHRTLKP